MLSRLLYGGRIDLLIGFGGTGVTIVVGTLIGLASGYAGGRLDVVLMRIVDVFFAFPFLVLVLAIVAMLGPSLLSIFIAIWAVGWVSNARILARHLLPNVISAALIFAMADAVGNILLSASLGYLGLGIPEPTPEWGSMVSEGQNYLVTAWWVPTLPCLAIVLVGIALSLVGDGIADALRRRR